MCRNNGTSFPHRDGCRLDHREIHGHRCRNGRDPVARLPAARYQAAGEGSGILQAVRD